MAPYCQVRSDDPRYEMKFRDESRGDEPEVYGSANHAVDPAYIGCGLHCPSLAQVLASFKDMHCTVEWQLPKKALFRSVVPQFSVGCHE